MADVITPRSKDYSQWYQDVVKNARLADHSPVRGCMVIRPNGYALWENMKDELDRKFKETGHVNAYFPLFIPESFLSKEAEHVEGFAKECAIVTHSRLRVKDDKSGVEPDPESRLDENLIVRPTSETIIWDTYRGWIQSWRDLPILINQWANVVRWEMRTRLFLRTMEFLWQEGHTAHATEAEAVEETVRILDIYADFAENYMAMPVIKGVKTESEKFAGAVRTYCIEALMQDGKALQAGTSHFLGQNFAKAFDVQFQSQNNTLEYVWATSWGVSTRLIGGLIMTHSDDQGLVIPPKLAPIQVALIPIPGKDQAEAVLNRAQEIAAALKSAGISVKLDATEQRPGWKFNEYEVQGVPIRLALGGRDLQNGTIELARRDIRTKETVHQDGLVETVKATLDAIQQNLFDRAAAYRAALITSVDTWTEFVDVLNTQGGFILAHWDGTAETEARIKEETKATIRCIPLDQKPEDGVDMLTGKPSAGRVLFARSY